MIFCVIAPSIDERGGWGRYTSDVIRCMRRSGHTVNTVVIEGGKVSLIVGLFRVLIAIRGARIIYAIDGWPYGAIAWLVTRLVRRPLIIGAIGTYSIAPLDGRWTRWMTGRAYMNADRVVAISSYTASQLGTRIPSAKIIVITPGIIPEQWRVSAHHENKDQPVIISVGALKERKGYYAALEAFAIARKQIPDIRWTIVGNTSNARYVERIRSHAINLGVIEHISFIERVSDAELRQLYSGASLFLLLSENHGNHFEGFGIVFLEAAAAGLPVIGTLGNGIQDAVGPNGVLIPQFDPGSAANAMVGLLRDKVRMQEMSKASVAWAEAHRLDSMCTMLEEIFVSLSR